MTLRLKSQDTYLKPHDLVPDQLWYNYHMETIRQAFESDSRSLVSTPFETKATILQLIFDLGVRIGVSIHSSASEIGEQQCYYQGSCCGGPMNFGRSLWPILKKSFENSLSATVRRKEMELTIILRP